MNEPSMNPIQQPSETVNSLRLHINKPQKTAQDWVRDMRMSAAVNKATTGVETDQVTPDLLLATSKRLLGISKREQEPDPKDSLAFQRFYGPEMLFSEHILRDNGKLGRNILWKATNKGSLDFMPVNALEKHISSVFYDSKLAQMMDGSSPLETIDSAYKTTRLGEGGIGSIESAPDEMRTVQPSYFGYIDPIRCYAEDTELMTEKGWKKVQDITGDDKLACLINGRLEYHKPTALSVYDYDGLMYGYDDGHIAYLVTPNHRMYTRCPDPKRNGEPCGYNIRTAEDIHETNRTVNTGMHLPILRNEDETVFHLPQVKPDLETPQVHGMPPQGASLKNVDELDVVDFAEYLGWYLSEGNCAFDDKRRNYVACITQSPQQNRENYIRIKNLIERLPFNATCPPPEAGKNRLTIARKQLVVYLQQFGKSDTKFIPEWIFNAPLKARLAFREAMLLGDGRDQRHLCTMSKRLAEDFARLQFELGESVFIYHEPERRIPNHPGIWVVYWHKRKENRLQKKIYQTKTVPYFTQNYAHKVYCPTVPGGIVYCRRSASYSGFWCGQSPESIRVGLDVYMAKNVMKGTDGKLYQKFIDAKTGKEVLLDSETAANSVVAAPEMMDAKTKSIFALGGPTGIRIVPRDSVQYYLPRADEAYSTASNLVTMLSGVKNMRVQMGCLHPDTYVLSIDKKGLISTTKAQTLSTGSLPGSTKEGISQVFPIRTTVAKFLPKKNWFRKVILKSGRSLITSADHKWPVLRNGEYTLLPANKLKPGDIALRTIFKDVPSRRTFVNHMLVNKELARVLGYIARSLDEPDNKKMRIQLPEEQYPTFLKAMERIGYTEGFNTYTMDYSFCVGIRDDGLKQLLRDMFGATDKTRHIPTEILSAGASTVGAFLDGYTADPTKVGRDSNDDIWILDIPNLQTRDELAFLFSRLETDTLYRDKVSGKAMDLALKLVPIGDTYGDMIMDEIKQVQDKINAPIMIDIDVNDNLYATANGVVTHNSKYPLQAVSIESREAPLVRGLDEASGKDMQTLIGKYLGARFAPQDGVVTAVRRDRIDVLYDDGTKGQVGLYVNFPMNAKGYINNTPVVKAGQAFKKGDVLASSNYTDDKGVAAIGTNLRTGWLSWKGGTYEDAVVISESAAKKLTSTTMYKTSVDLDRTISLGKQNYITWKPGEFTKEQMNNLDANGIVKPGTVLHKEDPMILAVRTSEPSPGTMGKRVLTDLSERWEHDNPGVVTDVVKTRNGVKVYATVTAPAEVGDKLSNGYGAKGTISMIVSDSEMPRNAKGEPLEMLFSPLGLITRCYDEETEFLTRDGWKFGKDIQDTDELYCYDTQTDTWDWGKQLEPFYSKRYEGPMYDYHGRAVDFSVTTGHKIWASVSGEPYQQYQIQDVFGKCIQVPCVATHMTQPKEHPFVLPMVDGSRTNIQDTYDAGDWAEFLGWFLSEGSATYNEASGRYEVTITQYASVNPIKVKLIHSLLKRLGIPYTYTKNERQFRMHNKRLAAYFSQFGYCHEKFIPGWLFEQPDYVIHRFLDSMLLGDGCITQNRRRVDGTSSYRCRIRLTSEKLIDQLQMLFCMVGIPTVKTCTGNDPRYPESKDQYYLGISMVDSTERKLGAGWEKREYSGMVYCPTVTTGYILTRRHGKVIILSNTNPAQLYEAQLGKIARKIGKPIVVPPFFKGSMQEYVTDQLKQHHISPDEDLINPETGLPIKDVLTGVSYIYKLKHLAESKMSARGTSSYDAELQPAGKGMDGCFPATQLIQTREGKRSIAAIARGVGIERITSLDDSKERRFSLVIDRFVRVVPAEDLLTITPTWGYSPTGRLSKAKPMHPTKNHAIYMYDMTQKHAIDIKLGDKLAGLGMRPTDHQMQVIWNLMHQSAIVDHDTLWVPYDPEADKLARFKVSVLKSLGAKLIDGHVVLPNYSLYQAALVDTDHGDLAIALNGLDKAAKAGYELSSYVKQLIAVWIPASVIPDYAYSAKELAMEQQRIADPIELKVQPYMGLMPLIVAHIGPYQSTKSSVRVFDLTVENTHRYVLDGGFVVSNSKRFGTLEQSAMAGHGAFDIIKDAKFIRGQSNSDFWRSLRTGDIPTMPGEPLVHKKFFAHLTGAGINVRKTPQGVSIFALTNSDVNELAGPRELRSRDTYESRNFRPIDGGLFGQDIFGINGDKWGYIQLDEPVPNPVMEEPLARLLNIPEKKFADVASGKEEVNGIKGGAAMKEALSKLNLDVEAERAHQNFKTASPSNKDKALKRYVAIERMRRAGVNAADYMLDKIPVLPPVYRPISSHNGLTMVADSNYLYARLLDARDDAREAKNLPKEFQQTARENIYNKWKELTGLYAPSDVKLQSKHVQGLLKWALGDSPKFSSYQRKVLSATVDTVGRGAITPDSRLKLNELGIPEEMAFNIMAPMVERSLVKRGYTPIQAMEMVKARKPQARDVLVEVMKDHPVMMNRAPTLHKLSIMAFNPKLVSGHAIRVNPSIVVPFGADFDGDANIGRICILITSEFLQFARNIEENHDSDLTFVKRVLHYMYSQIKLPLAERSTYMAFRDTKTLINAIEQSGIKQVVMDIDLADMPHGPMTTKDGGAKHNINFYEAAPGVRVLAYDETTSKLVWADVSYWSEHRDLPVEIVHLAGGRDIITDDDPRAVYGIAQDAESLIPQRFTPTEAKAHNVVVPCARPGVDTAQLAIEVNYVREADGAVSASEFQERYYTLDFEFGQLLGILAGDGWWDKQDYEFQEVFGGASSIKVSDNEGWNAKYISAVLRGLFGDIAEYSHVFKKEARADRYGDTVRYSYHNEAFSTFNPLLTNLLGGLGDDKTAGSANKHLPVWFKAAPEEFRRGLLCGLIATDGSISVSHGKAKAQLMVGFCSTSLRLCRELRELCWSLGISASICFSKTTARGNSAWQVTISTYDLKSHDGIFVGLCHERKLQTYNETSVAIDATQNRLDYRPFPKCVADVVFKWFKCPNIEKNMRTNPEDPEYQRRLRISNMYMTAAKYRHKGYITKYGVELIDEYVQDCIANRFWAIHQLDETMAKLEADVHCELAQEWKLDMWKALHILKDQIPAEVYSTAKTLVTRRAMLGTGCKSLLDAIVDVRTQGLEPAEFGLGIEPLYQEWHKLCTESDCVWLPIESIEKTGKVETGYDLTVPGYETFVSSEGVVLSNTVNIHAPVSDKARQEAYAKMFPERNLIAMRSRTIAYKPEKEYQQGLYIGTRVKQGADVRTHYFNTLEEAKEAYRQGLIDIDDPIEIKSK